MSLRFAWVLVLIVVATDPARIPPPPADEDTDGMPNDWEDQHRATDNRIPDADGDFDADGFPNLAEYQGGSDPDDPRSIPLPLRVTRIHRKPVDMRFKGYIVKVGGDPDVIDPKFWEVTLNYGHGSETAVVPLGGAWHGYKLGPLQKQKLQVNPGAGIPARVVDVYVLTIQRPGDKPIKLVENRWAHINETYADLVVTRGNDAGQELLGKTITETLTVNGVSYTITAISEEAVTIGDATLPVSPE